jgi:hypothetical protein
MASSHTEDGQEITRDLLNTLFTSDANVQHPHKVYMYVIHGLM